MQLVFLGEDEQWEEISKSVTDNECIRVHSITEFYAQEAEIYLYTKESIVCTEYLITVIRKLKKYGSNCWDY